MSGEGYFPVFHSLYDEVDTIGVTNDNGKPIGMFKWREDWGCYVFNTVAGAFVGPAFMAAVLAEMIRREAERRKKAVQQLPNVQSNSPAGTLALEEDEKIIGCTGGNSSDYKCYGNVRAVPGESPNCYHAPPGSKACMEYQKSNKTLFILKKGE